MSFFHRLGIAALVFCLAVPAARAAKPIFPTGSRIGLVPPAGLVESRTFPGFEDIENKVSIVLADIPPAAYSQVEAALSKDGARTQGVIIEKHELIPIGSGMALLSVGRQESDSAHKWLMLGSWGGITAMIAVQVPESAAATYPEAAIRASLETVTFRPDVPIDEQLSVLPFRLTDLAGLHVVKVLQRSIALLSDGIPEQAQDISQPHVVVAVVPGGPQDTDDRGRFAVAALGAIPGFKDQKVTFAEPVRLKNQTAYEVRADAKEIRTGADVKIVQWLRFGNNGYLQIVGVTQKDTWLRDFPRFRAVRDGVVPKEPER